MWLYIGLSSTACAKLFSLDNEWQITYVKRVPNKLPKTMSARKREREGGRGERDMLKDRLKRIALDT